MKKVLLTGAGAPGGPGIINALKTAGYHLFIADNNPNASGRALHEPFIKIPKANDKTFLPFILAYCEAKKIDVVFPLVTKELFAFSEAKKLFSEKGIQVIVSEKESLHIANDKGRLYQHLYSKNIPVPSFQIVHAVDELIAAATNLGYPSKAVCVKPAVSNGSRGVRVLQENIDEYDLLFNEKPTHLFSTLQRICDILEGHTFPSLLVSEYLPGKEFTIDALVQDGIPKLILPRSRDKMNNGISVAGTFVKHDTLIAYCDQILRSLNLSGPIGLQVKEAADGSFKLLEINPRIQGTSIAASGLGINLPDLAIRQLYEPIEVDMSQLAWGTSFVRYYEEAFYSEGEGGYKLMGRT